MTTMSWPGPYESRHTQRAHSRAHDRAHDRAHRKAAAVAAYFAARTADDSPADDDGGHHGRHGRRHGRGRPRGLYGFPEGGPRGGYGRRGRYGERARRGDVRAAVLLLLAEAPMHGYQIIQEIGERSGGVWEPSPGAIYPAISLLEDEGLVTVTAEGGRKLAQLTDDGRAYLEDNREALGDPFAAQGSDSSARDLRDLMTELIVASKIAVRNADPDQVEALRTLLLATRRDFYRILGGDPATPTED